MGVEFAKGYRMRLMTPGVHMLEGISGCNVYLLDDGGELTLVDGGMFGSASRIEAQLREAGYDIEALQRVILTHAHADHVGGAAELARRSEAQIMVHADDRTFVEHPDSLPAATPIQHMIRWMGRLMPGRMSCRVDRALIDGENINVLGGLIVIHTPGHTPGSVCLYAPERRVLFCGDLLMAGRLPSCREHLRFGLRVFTLDVGQSRRSAARLADLDSEVLCPGHGAPALAGAQDMIRALLARLS